MNLENMKKDITGMDVKSDEFINLYAHINEKYWDFESPDSLQMAAKLVNTWLHKGDPAEIIVVANVVKEVFEMRHKKQKACTGTLGFTDETFHFDIYTTEVEKDKMGKMLIDAHKSLEKQGKFGKSYFNKKKAP